MLYVGLRQLAIAEGMRPLGFLPKDEAASIGSRHLGLITADEITDLQQKLDRLGQLAQQHLDLDAILALGASAPALTAPEAQPTAPPAIRIAVARDEAFCFLYEENLELLTALGATLVYFSPLRDHALPPDIGGLYLPGGYPELYAQALSQNTAMRDAIRRRITAGLPTIAECGGFLYLHRTLDGVPMAGVLEGRAQKKDRLQRFGYITLTAKADNLLCAAGESIRAHEFHYYDGDSNGASFLAEKPLSGRSWDCVCASESLYAGFPHLYFPANPAFAQNFLRKAAQYAFVSAI